MFPVMWVLSDFSSKVSSLKRKFRIMLGCDCLGLCLGLSATLTRGINENEKLLTQNSLMSEEN